MKSESVRIDSLNEGDCFFYMSPTQRTNRDALIVGINEYRKEIGASPLTAQERAAYYGATTDGFIVYAIVRATGERCVQRLSDGKVQIWYDDGTVVQHSPTRDIFLARIEQMKQDRKKLQDEQERMNRPRSKKANRAEAIPA